MFKVTRPPRYTSNAIHPGARKGEIALPNIGGGSRMHPSRQISAMSLAFLAFSEPAAAAETGCASVRLQQYPVCRDTTNGIFLSDSAENAEWGVTIAQQAERRFSRYFGDVP